MRGRGVVGRGVGRLSFDMLVLGLGLGWGKRIVG